MEVIKLSSRQAEEHNRRGNDLMLEDNLGDALKEFKQALKFDPSHAGAMYNLGYVHYLMGHYKKAATLLKRASKLDPNQPGIYVNLAHIYSEMLNSPRRALVIIRKALKLLPESAEVRVSYGDYYLSSGKPEKARREYLEALKLEPDNQNASSGMAEIMNREALKKAEAGDYSSGVFLLRRAINEFPSETFLLTNLGIIYYEMGDMKRSEEAYRTACDLDPISPVPHFNLGFLYMSAERKDEAKEEYEAVLEMDPAYPDVHTELADIYASEDNYEEVFDVLEEGKEFRPDDERILCSLGFYYIKMDDLKQAEENLKEALKIMPDYFAANYHMARLKGIEGKTREGVKFFERAFDQDSEEACQWYREDMDVCDPGIQALSKEPAFVKLVGNKLKEQPE